MLPGLGENISMPAAYVWERGREILLGAELAVEMVNAQHGVLVDTTHLKMIPVSRSCAYDEFSYISALADSIQADKVDTVIAVIGLFCPTEVKIVTALASKMNANVIQFSLSSSPVLFDEQKYPDLIHLVKSAEDAVRGLLAFVSHNHWNRLGIISDHFDSVYFDTARLVRNLRFDFNVTVRSISFDHTDRVGLFEHLSSNIIILAMGIPNTFTMLCRAHLRGESWPDYAWIIPYHDVDDVMLYASSIESKECDAETILEGVIFIQQQLFTESNESELFAMHYREHSTSPASEVNPYGYIVYKAIRALVNSYTPDTESGIGIFQDASGSGANEHDVQSSTNYKMTNETEQNLGATIYQIRNSTQVLLAYYINASLQIIFPDEIAVKEKVAAMFETSEDVRSPVLVIVLHTTTAIIAIFMTAILVLYCYHRQHNSIKSTSFCLSLLMFAGCYLILLYVVVSDMFFVPRYREILPVGYHKFTCVVRVWIHALGVPSTLIFATLIIKIARVYYIFLELSPAKLRFSSDRALFVYVMLMMIPTVILLVLFTVDIITNKSDVHVSTSNDTVDSTGSLVECMSRYLFLWLVLLLAYFLILQFALVIVAVITRKIQYSNFKDTKKVNALVVMLIYTYSFTLAYWMILQSIERGDNVVGRLILHFGHLLIVMECQVLLFVPKVYPLVKSAVLECLYKTCVTEKIVEDPYSY